MAAERLNSRVLEIFFFAFLIAAAFLVPAADSETTPQLPHGGLRMQKQRNAGMTGEWNSRRTLIGSMAPTCTYECRGCKYRCRAEQVPVDGNDPINSPYRYKCVCHR
ncbi:hypothetical protein Nepgr_030943 [Nepenthes gracilis]|uniref:Stomagen C-terminal domain-containing protein n=1 Tax=Nepenthes gracilis TaxID=150966 RepID=A0AAD3Y6A8_NEPGR|nr:hypothetical protein Nepgr_030943 [Nepenthes gracilis]